jgi:hypothetical protein
MSRLLFVPFLSIVVPAVAGAKPWHGLRPGVATAADVVQKFGEPTKRLTAKGQEVLVYSAPGAISGTVQAQFKTNATTHRLERIDVYPAPVLTADAIEKAYGPACDPLKVVEPCYVRKATASRRAYFLYSKLGLAIFFRDDGKTVQSFAFLPDASGAVEP